MPLIIQSLIVTGLRGFSLLSKLIFTIALARLLPVEEFAYWVLIVAAIGYGTFLLGAEIYNLTLRNFIANGYDAVVGEFSAQWTFYGATYAIVLFVAAIVTFYGGEGFSSFALLVALILILEHATHELHRLAFFQDHQIHANMILMVKSALWMIPTGVYMTYVPNNSGLWLVLSAWATGASICALYAFFTYRRFFCGLHPAYLAEYVGRHVELAKMILPFFTIAIALRTPLLLDRYLVGYFDGPEMVAVYGYYAVFGNGIQAFFDALILARLTPRVLQLSREPEAQLATLKSFVIQSTFFWLFAIGILFFVTPYVNQFTQKESFQADFYLLFLILAGQMIFSLASVLHYGLYAMHCDKQLANGALVYLAISLILLAALIPQFGAYGAALALTLAASGLLMIRSRQLRMRARSL